MCMREDVREVFGSEVCVGGMVTQRGYGGQTREYIGQQLGTIYTQSGNYVCNDAIGTRRTRGFPRDFLEVVMESFDPPRIPTHPHK